MAHRGVVILAAWLLASYGALAFGHGVMQDPPARNWFCGADTRPEVAIYGTPEYPVCTDVFTGEDEALNYEYMSVLSHSQGRSVVSPLPENVCGFDSEMFGYGATPWDKPVDWPTSPMSAGRNKITWNISWGPHFSDTEEFRYWITKPGFDFQVGRALSWNDLETEPFCVLEYDDANPTANADVIARKGSEQFDTYCSVPERNGRHVIYGEWGRNYYTYERFHGCMDLTFDGSGSAPPLAASEPVAEPEPVAESELAAEPEMVAEPEPVAEPEMIAESEPAAAAPDSEPVTEAEDSVNMPEPVTEAEDSANMSEPVTEAEDSANMPEPVAEAEDSANMPESVAAADSPATQDEAAEPDADSGSPFAPPPVPAASADSEDAPAAPPSDPEPDTEAPAPVSDSDSGADADTESAETPASTGDAPAPPALTAEGAVADDAPPQLPVTGGSTTPAAVTAETSSQPVTARIVTGLNDTTVRGTGSLTLSAEGSTGNDLSYRWSIQSDNPDLYTLNNASSATATLLLSSPPASSTLSIALNVSGQAGSDSAVLNLVHEPDGGSDSDWEDLGPITDVERTLNAGDAVSVRIVLDNGNDVFYPAQPLAMTTQTVAATAWPYLLGLAINGETDAIAVGMLDPNGNVEPVEDAAANRVYAQKRSSAASAFTIVNAGEPPPRPSNTPTDDQPGQLSATDGAVAEPDDALPESTSVAESLGSTADDQVPATQAVSVDDSDSPAEPSVAQQPQPDAAQPVDDEQTASASTGSSAGSPGFALLLLLASMLGLRRRRAVG